jgi:hypothetical protein
VPKRYRRFRRAELALVGCLGVGLFVQGILTSDTWSLVLGAAGVATLLVFSWGRPPLRIVFSAGTMVIATGFMGFVAVHQLAKHDWLGAGIGTVGFVLGGGLVGLGVWKRRRSARPPRAS